MHVERARLRDSVKIRLVYQDDTRFGSVVSGRIDDLLRTFCAEIVGLRREVGMNSTVARSVELLDRARSEHFRDLYERVDVLREDCIYPDMNSVRPVALDVMTSDSVLGSIPLDRVAVRELASLIGSWHVDARAPSSGTARRIWDSLASLGAFTNDPPPVPVSGDILFVGHATVRLGGSGSRVLIDPFVLPTTPRYGAGYQPLTSSELAPDAICITHSHPDHFDVGSLLRFGADTPIFVPQVPRESILAIDMAHRLREVGFTSVRVLQWYEEAFVGKTRIVALPFYGEQPTSNERLHPEVRNFGNLYLVETGGRRCVLTVDGGTDCAGSTVGLAAAMSTRSGSVDLLFGGYRSWALYPLRYLFSSVSRYLLFVPRGQWLVRQKIMNDADDVLDTCERWGARWLVPYADGGAPWYWDLGLGPRLDTVDAGPEHDHFDPRPESVRRAAQRRSGAQEGYIESPVKVVLARPGDALDPHGETMHLRRLEGHLWPFDGAA